ncbi:MAG: O-antigen ligase family protein [Methyloligellaceae bacterium]
MLLSGPFIALTGNAPSEIWLVFISVIFLARSAINREWQWARQIWFRASLVFWSWLILVSATSPWPASAMEHSLIWIRFPIFAAALISWLGKSERLWKHMLLSLISSVLLLTVILLAERVSNPDAIRLWGTWAQNPKPGWYMLGFGLPVVLWALGELKNKPSTFYWALPLVVLLVGTTLSTGEVYITLSMIFGCVLFVLLSRFWSWRLLLLGSACVLITAGVLATNSQLLYRFTEEVMLRLPWLPTSDYYDPWIGGLNAGFLHPVMGLGAGNYEFYCEKLKVAGQLEILGIKHCFPHPHNLYIQVFAETGIIGLGLFILLIISLTGPVLHRWNVMHLNVPRVTGLTILIVTTWPISTYSQAFGQHKNLFTWFLIGWALATVHLFIEGHKRKTSGQ